MVQQGYEDNMCVVTECAVGLAAVLLNSQGKAETELGTHPEVTWNHVAHLWELLDHKGGRRRGTGTLRGLYLLELLHSWPLYLEKRTSIHR